MPRSLPAEYLFASLALIAIPAVLPQDVSVNHPFSGVDNFLFSTEVAVILRHLK
jgi:hypothetical protein